MADILVGPEALNWKSEFRASMKDSVIVLSCPSPLVLGLNKAFKRRRAGAILYEIVK